MTNKQTRNRCEKCQRFMFSTPRPWLCGRCEVQAQREAVDAALDADSREWNRWLDSVGEAA